MTTGKISVVSVVPESVAVSPDAPVDSRSCMVSLAKGVNARQWLRLHPNIVYEYEQLVESDVKPLGLPPGHRIS